MHSAEPPASWEGEGDPALPAAHGAGDRAGGAPPSEDACAACQAQAQPEPLTGADACLHLIHDIIRSPLVTRGTATVRERCGVC